MAKLPAELAGGEVNHGGSDLLRSAYLLRDNLGRESYIQRGERERKT